jgi:hypothetical protein
MESRLFQNFSFETMPLESSEDIFSHKEPAVKGM